MGFLPTHLLVYDHLEERLEPGDNVTHRGEHILVLVAPFECQLRLGRGGLRVKERTICLEGVSSAPVLAAIRPDKLKLLLRLVVLDDRHLLKVYLHQRKLKNVVAHRVHLHLGQRAVDRYAIEVVQYLAHRIVLALDVVRPAGLHNV